jgi:hypothetical protein
MRSGYSLSNRIRRDTAAPARTWEKTSQSAGILREGVKKTDGLKKKA